MTNCQESLKIPSTDPKCDNTTKVLSNYPISDPSVILDEFISNYPFSDPSMI